MKNGNKSLSNSLEIVIGNPDDILEKYKEKFKDISEKLNLNDYRGADRTLEEIENDLIDRAEKLLRRK